MDIDSFIYLAMKQCQGLGYTKGKIAVLALHTNHAIAVRGLIKRPSLSSVLKAPSQTKYNILWSSIFLNKPPGTKFILYLQIRGSFYTLPKKV